MATTKNIHEPHFNSDYEENNLLNGLLLILGNSEHAASISSDMFICVCEKSRCYNIFKKNANGKPVNYKRLEVKLLTKAEITKGGKSCAL